MRKTILAVTGLGAAALIGACSSLPQSSSAASKPRPDWTDGTAAAYPVAEYLTGIGSAASLAEAEDKARGQIADFFLLQVTVQSKSKLNENLRQQGSQKIDLLFQNVSQEVQTNSAATIEGVQIADTWKDPKTLRYDALAVLDRRKAAQAIQDQIQDLDRETRELKAALDQNPDRFLKAKAALSLLSRLENRRRLNSRLEILSGQSVPVKFDETSLRSEAQKILAGLLVSVLVQGDDSGRLESGIVQGLSALGLQVSGSTNAAQADVVIAAKAQTQPLNISGLPFQRVLSSANVSLRRGADVFAQFNSSAYGNGGAAEDAKDQSLAALSSAVASQLQDALVKYFSGL